jgi:hypothetical protein
MRRYVVAVVEKIRVTQLATAWWRREAEHATPGYPILTEDSGCLFGEPGDTRDMTGNITRVSVSTRPVRDFFSRADGETT